MGITYKIEAEAGMISIVAEGEIGAVDLRDSLARFAADPLFTPDLAQLFDGRLAKFSFSGNEAWNLAGLDEKNRPTAKTAIVVDKKGQAWARMFVGWRGETSKIFHDIASAREWLGLPSEDDS